MIHYN